MIEVVKYGLTERGRDAPQIYPGACLCSASGVSDGTGTFLGISGNSREPRAPL